ncbi:MAG: hypothetical protein WCO60_02250 [Verrucomicrobiota bacterium]
MMWLFTAGFRAGSALRLREQKQVIDFIEGEPEQFPHKEDSTITR